MQPSVSCLFVPVRTHGTDATCRPAAAQAWPLTPSHLSFHSMMVLSVSEPFCRFFSYFCRRDTQRRSKGWRQHQPTPDHCFPPTMARPMVYCRAGYH